MNYTSIPSFVRAALNGSRPVQMSFKDVGDANVAAITSSFFYDQPGAPLKSTQQLNVDWSQFANHTFFNSAQAKVNVAFDQIINGYPFDGTRTDVEAFFEKLTGFDKWVFNQFPTFVGELSFSGTQTGEDNDGTKGVWIKVNDYAGGLFPELSSAPTGRHVLDPSTGSMTIEAQIFIPSRSLDVQVIFQKAADATHGYVGYLSQSSAVSSTAQFTFAVVSGSYVVSASTRLNKGAFNHVAAIIDSTVPEQTIRIFNNAVQQSVSQAQYRIGPMGIKASPFYIGTGSTIIIGGTSIVPKQTFSGSIDEFRVFMSARTAAQQAAFAQKSMFSTPDMQLYYKFNEPPPPLASTSGTGIDAIVIDSSGNSLHSIVNNFTSSLRVSSSLDALNPMSYEKASMSPVLFPAHTGVVSLNQTLLTSASSYDANNPNLISRLIPQEYLLDGQLQDGQPTIGGFIEAQYSGSSGPGTGQLGSAQLILSFLYIWARFFDEMKLFVDAFRNVKHVDYDINETVPDNFVQDLLAQYGFKLPPILFNDATLDQYVNAENVLYNNSTNVFPLKMVQNQLLRRVLINMPDVIRSKGTQHSIKSFLRAVGIDPDNSVRIRERGGPTSRQLSFARETKRDVGVMLQMTSSALVTSPALLMQRTEPGFPESSRTLNDKNLTSGSWTLEAIVKWPPIVVTGSLTSVTQSLVRMMGTDVLTSPTQANIFANMVAVMSSSLSESVVRLYVRPGRAAASPILRIEINPGNMFNSERWHISFGRVRNDAINSRVSSSYFLRAASENFGDVVSYVATSSFFNETPSGESNAFNDTSGSGYADFNFFACGANTFYPVVGDTLTSGAAAMSYRYLNDTSNASVESRALAFDGRISNVRFWSKALTDDEWREHVRNYKSVGVYDPLINWNFNTTSSGSFERLRSEAVVKQTVRNADAAGDIFFSDHSQNNMTLTGSGFLSGSQVLLGEVFQYSMLSPNFDTATSSEKIRIRGFKDIQNVANTPWAGIAPVHEVQKSEQPTDDTRFAIEFSLMDALNRDIVTLFATFDAIDNAIGDPELLFSPDYPNLDRLRQLYFNRLTNKVNFKSFFEFFRWFDTSIGGFIEQLVPRKTQFKGTNYVVESHMLERPKFSYSPNESYLTERNRAKIRSQILLQLIGGSLRKY